MQEFGAFVQQVGFPTAVAAVLIYHLVSCSRLNREVLTALTAQMGKLELAIQRLLDRVG